MRPVSGIGSRRSVEQWDRFFELVCAGASVSAAAAEIGVARQSAWERWRNSAPMELKLLQGRGGGLGQPAECEQVAGRVRRALTSEDRAVIAAGVRKKWTYAEIGEAIGRSPSVICREVARNKGPDGSYHGTLAHAAARQRRRRPKEFRLVAEPGLCRRIETWMDEGWSPKLIARVLREESPRMIMGRVSHETIYQALYVQTRGSLRKDLYRQLSTTRPRRQPRVGAKRTNSPYKEAFKISQRPAEVADRAVPGHWEGDLVMGTAGGVAVGTLVERSTRFTILLHLPGRHDAESVAAAMIREMSELPEHLRQSLTWDRGTELARYDKIQTDLAMPVYFCDPHAPWQRGTNENTNRLLRHWLTKGTDLSRFSAADLRRIAASLNARPRPTLNMQTPAQALDQLLTNPAAA
ncbi:MULTISPECIES: IS30 family transposase [unclassified Nocardioides]|uniref:IS30 family transposase n=1 Tax=unclassified Nocardioides TaxID=2615069 RepID=UPI0006F7E684|nr:MULTISPECIES: IS30 family transposase [unclassified Nocardioides]KRA39246.1 integrase [Nocardioides sp. Root614]KRA93205.1 integrase [Nocardioides sp. Root682]